jgi:hypothetical protein
MPDVTARILVITDRADPTPALLDAVEQRAAKGAAQFRVVVLNPALRSCTCSTRSGTTSPAPRRRPCTAPRPSWRRPPAAT